MATLWEADSVQISCLANAQYPQFSNDWQYIFPHSSSSADGDLHINMAVDSFGTGSTNNNIGNSPLIAEVILVKSSQVAYFNSLNAAHAKTHGIFRFYTEHATERHFELHPVTELYKWNGSAFAFDSEYRTNNIQSVPEGAAKALSTYTDLARGNNQTVTATVLADNNSVMFTYPTGAGADTVNYIQYDGKVVQTLTNDAVSSFITILPTNSPAGPITGARVMRCRLISNTTAAIVAAGLVTDQSVTVNALNRVDMLGVSNVISSLGDNQTTTFVRPVEWITLGITNLSPAAPFISVQPQNQTNVAGATVTFTVTATGAAPLNYSWRFNGTNLPTSTNAILSLTNVSSIQSGGYSVVVTNTAGSVTSILASLQIYATAAAKLNFPLYASNAFQFGVVGVPGFNYAIQASSNLSTTNWVSLQTNASPFTFMETNGLLFLQRFYRAVY
jgi:hypothetical protein